MAERRMFTKKVTESDSFLEMPVSTQCLYFHLCMNADDDGFVKNPKRLAKMVGGSDDDLKLLMMKSFVVAYESGIIVIKHWRMHNLLRKDRYTPSEYIDEKSMLFIKENGAYTLDSNQGKPLMATNWQPNGNQMATQDRIGKDSNNNICPKSSDENAILMQNFEIIYNIYPKKVGKTVAFENYKQWVSKKGKKVGGTTYHLTNRQIYLAVKRYVDNQTENGQTDYQYWKNFDTLMGRQLLDYVDLEND